MRDLIDRYLEQKDWRVTENSNMSYSVAALMNYSATSLVASHVLRNVYPLSISKAHKNGDLHIHDLGYLSGYCAGWDLQKLLMMGFQGGKDRVQATPPKHFRSALDQIVNFMGTLQNEWAGAQAFNNVDTLLAPFIKHDKLGYKEVKQCIQEFIFSLNSPSRFGAQTVFSNISIDLTVPKGLEKTPICVGGKFIQEETYSAFQREMNMFNTALLEIYLEGDAKGRPFTFPIPTYSLTKTFDWNGKVAQLLFKVTAKFGIPYFQNFINSNLNPEDVRSMCCRLSLDLRELRQNITGGLFGSGSSTGSLGVVTLNLPRYAYLARKSKTEFFKILRKNMDLAMKSLEIKRKTCNDLLEKGLYPYTKIYLGHFNHHFNTLGLIGMNEACLNLFGEDIRSAHGRRFAKETLLFMRQRLLKYQEKTKHLYNLEATPAEGTSYRLAKMDKKKFPDIITAGKHDPYYTNSTQLSVGADINVFDALEHQEDLQTLYTSGTVFHCYIGEEMPDIGSLKNFVKKIAYNTRLPYFTITPVFSICPDCGRLDGIQEKCPKCSKECEVYTRVVGYFRPVATFNKGKKEEFRERKLFKTEGDVHVEPVKVEVKVEKLKEEAKKEEPKNV